MIVSRQRVIFNYLFLGLFSFLALAPLIGIVLMALRDPDLGGTRIVLDTRLHLENLERAWVAGNFEASIRSSLIVVFGVVPISCVLSILAGYAFGMMRFRGNNLLFLTLIVGLVIPQEATIIPLFYGLNALHLTDTYWALIVPQVGQSLAFGAFWMRAFFRSVPPELPDAAKIDGAGPVTALWRVLVPLGRPAITSMAVLFFLWTWNDFLLGLVLVSSEDVRPAPVGLTFFRGRYATDWTLLAAASLFVALPVLIVYVLLQRHFIRGVLGGAIR
jgi:raffinose/stachyose/melibiose transport system permease protein